MKNLDDILNEISNRREQGRSFVIYAKPGSRVVSVIFVESADIAEGRRHFVFAPFQGTALRLPLDGKIDIDYSPKKIEKASNPSTDDGERDFELMVEKAKSEIQAGTFSKVVLSRCEKLPGDFNIANTFRNLLFSYENAFRYCWFHPISGLWLGATPELLVECDSRVFKTVALAGTRTNSDDDKWPEKERHEQRIVSEYIAGKVRSMTDNLLITEPFTVRAGNLSHIKSEISGELRSGFSADELIGELHPTPAVCGFPTEASKEFILQNESYDRKYYTGYIGEVAGDRAEVYVNLRCMELFGSSATLYAGCGITDGSVPEKEYLETAAKMLTMKNILYEN